MKTKITISFVSLLLFSTIYPSKITIWNNTFSPIKATVTYSSDKKKDIDIDAASHESWDNVVYNMKSIKIKDKSLNLQSGISKRFEVFYDGEKIRAGRGLSPSETFIMPDPSLKYNEVCFLASHNSHAAHPYGYLYAQQDKKISDQLKSGVRALLLDTYPVKKDNLTKEAQPQSGDSLNDYEVMLWHRSTGRNLKRTFKDALKTIKEFLIKNPRAIITIQLENYSPGSLIDHIIEKSNISKFVLKPNDWDPSKKNGWPTLKWMIDNDKRLVIFDSRSGSSYCYYQWQYTTENQYGELDIKKAAKLRADSSPIKNYLMTINYFGTITSPINYPAANSTKLRELINYISKNGLDGNYKKRYPNFIALDYVNRGKDGDPLKLINEINHKSKISKNRGKTIFRPLIP